MSFTPELLAKRYAEVIRILRRDSTPPEQILLARQERINIKEQFKKFIK